MAAPGVGTAARRLSREDRRTQLLDSAAALLVRDGGDALTMEAVGAEARVSKTLGYAYFDNIDAVVLALRARELQALYERVEAAAAGAGSFDGRIRAVFGAYFDTVAERGLLLGELEETVRTRRLTPDAGDGTDDFIAWLAGIIDEEFQCGRRRATGYAVITAGLANAHAAIWKASRYSRRHIERTAVAYAIGGLRAAVAADDA